MFNSNTQGKTGKAGTTQETTAQNAEIQSYFNGISQEQLNAVCEALSTTYSSPGGLQFNPSYFENYLIMTNRFINSARMGDDKRNMVLNAIGFLCSALLANKSEYEEWEHIADEYYPEDLEDITIGEDGDFETKKDLIEAVCYEIDNILTDWDPSYDNYYPEDWRGAREIITEYLQVLTDNGCELPESVPSWVYTGIVERNAKYRTDD